MIQNRTFLAAACTLAAIPLLQAEPLRADFKPDIQYAQVGEVKLAYYTRGEGDPLLMINGFLSTMSLWDPLMIETLAKQNKLILFDNRGVGLSTDTKENNTTIPQMADDAAGLLKALGIKKANILAYSMGARIGQQFLIRHPEMVNKAVLCAADPGGKYQDPAAPDVEGKLNNPDTPKMEKLALTAPDTEAGREALKAAVDRIKTAVAAGTIPDDFEVSKQTTERQDRARTTLWSEDNSNFENLKNIKVPVLITDGRSDAIDPPKNSLLIANQIPFSWLAYFWGGHSFLYTEPKHFADTVNVFLQPGEPVTDETAEQPPAN